MIFDSCSYLYLVSMTIDHRKWLSLKLQMQSQNKPIFIKYLTNQPVKIETYFVGQFERNRPLKDVSDLVAAFQALPNSPLTSAFVGDITLHLHENDHKALPGNHSLTSLSGTFEAPLIIKMLGSAINGDFFQAEQNNDLSNYLIIAESLNCDPSIAEICRKITASEPGIMKATSFVFLEGSSGAGKSQTAFAIQANLRSSRMVFYFLFHSPRAGDQPIYLNFKNISEFFRKCCDADAEIYNADAKSPTCDSLFQQSLYVFGFVYELLRWDCLEHDVSVTRKSGQQILDLMKQKGILMTRPVFIVDECIAINEDSLKKVRFVRNCFRSLGLGLVMLGTDSRAVANMNKTSRSDIPKPWCYMISSFPAFNFSARPLPSTCPDWLKAILQYSRPLFAKLFLDHMELNPQPFDIDLLLKEVFEDLISRKKIFGNFFGKLGQIRLFQNAHYDLDRGDSSLEDSLIHSHFAQLDVEMKNFVLDDSGSIAGKDDIWNPSSVFPKIGEDVLLYLFLMGGKGYPAFRIEAVEVPYAYFWMKLKSDFERRQTVTIFKNSLQASNDGMFLESLLCSTVCLASHANGIAGIGVKQFLLNLVFQVQSEKGNASDVTIADLDMLDSFNFTVPFLSPPNQDWPTFFNDVPRSSFGNLERSRNFMKVDLWTSCGLAGESKDYGKTIDLKTMKNIISRIPELAKVELVFTRKLQQSYFKNESFETFFRKSRHIIQKSYFKIDASKFNTDLEPIRGMPSSTTVGGIVVFVEISPSIF